MRNARRFWGMLGAFVTGACVSRSDAIVANAADRWSISLVGAVEKAIRDAGLGLNPASDGQLVRVPIPQLTQERRTELVKAAHKYAEGARVAVRGVRRDAMEQIKGLEKKHTIGEDVAKDWHDEVQKLTDQHIKKVDDTLADKEKDIRQV